MIDDEKQAESLISDEQTAVLDFLFKEKQIETDTDYKELGQLFPEDE